MNPTAITPAIAVSIDAVNQSVGTKGVLVMYQGAELVLVEFKTLEVATSALLSMTRMRTFTKLLVLDPVAETFVAALEGEPILVIKRDIVATRCGRVPSASCELLAGDEAEYDHHRHDH